MGQGSGDDGVPPAPFSSAAAAAHSPPHSPLSVGVSSASSATSSSSTPPSSTSPAGVSASGKL